VAIPGGEILYVEALQLVGHLVSVYKLLLSNLIHCNFDLNTFTVVTDTAFSSSAFHRLTARSELKNFVRSLLQ